MSTNTSANFTTPPTRKREEPVFVPVVSPLARLRTLVSRVNELIAHPEVRSILLRGKGRFLARAEKYDRECDAREERDLQSARRLLMKGKFRSAASSNDAESVVIDAALPRRLIKSLDLFGNENPIAINLPERDAALGKAVWKGRSRGKHLTPALVKQTQCVQFAIRCGRSPEPFNPFELSEYRRVSEADRFAIACAKSLALRDALSQIPVEVDRDLDWKQGMTRVLRDYRRYFSYRILEPRLDIVKTEYLERTADEFEEFWTLVEHRLRKLRKFPEPDERVMRRTALSLSREQQTLLSLLSTQRGHISVLALTALSKRANGLRSRGAVTMSVKHLIRHRLVREVPGTRKALRITENGLLWLSSNTEQRLDIR